jgi:hypothetical protein
MSRRFVMSETVQGLVAVEIARDEARVWLTGVESGTKPERIMAPSEMTRHHHVREAQHHGGHDTDHDSSTFYDSIAYAVAPASQIVLIGHGTGKADSMLKFTQFLERKHPDVAAKVVGAIDADIEALTDNQILSLIRDWFDGYHEYL